MFDYLSGNVEALSQNLCVIDTQGRMTLQDRAGNLMQFQALDAGEVKW